MSNNKYTARLRGAFLSTLLLPLFLTACGALSPFGTSGDEKGDGQEVTPLFQAAQISKDEQPIPQQRETVSAQPSTVSRPSSSGLVTQRVGTSTTKQDISELRFEIKRLQAEIAHLNSEITNLNNRSEMWRDPQSIFNTKIVLTNGTIFNGYVVYQDHQFLNIETWIGSLVLQLNFICRILERISGFDNKSISEPHLTILYKQLTATRRIQTKFAS